MVYWRPGEVRAAIVTCGGLCPGLNTVIRELVMCLTYSYQVKTIFGVPGGYRYVGVWTCPPVVSVPRLYVCVLSGTWCRAWLLPNHFASLFDVRTGAFTRRRTCASHLAQCQRCTWMVALFWAPPEVDLIWKRSDVMQVAV